jgi:inner membrane transporter RhtA
LSTPDRSTPEGQTGLSVAMVLGAIVSVQFGGALATELFDKLGPEGTVFARSTLAAFVFLAITRPSLGMFGDRGFREVIVFAVVLFGMNCCFYAAIDRIPLGSAVTLEFVGPLGIAIWGSRSRLDLIWAVLAAAGILLLSGGLGAGGLFSAGAALALGSGIFWAGYIIQSARVGAIFPGLGALAVALALSALFTAPLGIAEAGSALLEPGPLAVCLAVGILTTVIPYTLEIEALRRLPNAVFGVMMSLEPAVAALVGLVILSQGVDLTEVIAIALVVVASAGALRSADTPPPLDS